MKEGRRISGEEEGKEAGLPFGWVKIRYALVELRLIESSLRHPLPLRQCDQQRKRKRKPEQKPEPKQKAKAKAESKSQSRKQKPKAKSKDKAKANGAATLLRAYKVPFERGDSFISFQRERGRKMGFHSVDQDLTSSLFLLRTARVSRSGELGPTPLERRRCTSPTVSTSARK